MAPDFPLDDGQVPSLHHDASNPAVSRVEPLSSASEKSLDPKTGDVANSEPVGEKGEHLDEEKVSLKSDEDAIIVDGNDVSKYIVDLRDDEDPAITFRSIVLGTVLAGLGATVVQLYLFKPIEMSVSTVFLLLIAYSLGKAWEILLPKRSLVAGTKFEYLGNTIEFINPGEFRLKEHAVAALIASTAAYGSAAVQNFAVQRLFYNTKVEALTAVLATFSTATFGYGLVGILRPLTVYPGEMVYWFSLPSVTVFQALHFDTESNAKRLKVFWSSFVGMFCWEIIPAYIFPLLNGFNIFCLASQKASAKTVDVFTNIFGGADGNEGLGLLSLSLDWQYIGGRYLSYPLIQQGNSWIGYVICYIAISGIYYSNTWKAMSFPMLSTSIFSANGSVYDQTAVFGDTFSLNKTALAEIGLPYLTGANAWTNLTLNMSIGGLIAHCILFWGSYAKQSVMSGLARTQPDPHYQKMLKYKEAPMWWYLVLLTLAFFAGIIVNVRGQTTLPWWGYIIALITGIIVTPFSTLLYARFGNGIATNQLFKMIAGLVHPGKPVANLYFSMWSHDVVSTSIGLAGDLKIGQYLKIPPREMFLTQVYGNILGCIINYVVMVSVTNSRKEILTDPKGTNVWSGQYDQKLNSNAITWSLANYMYGKDGEYFLIPLGLLIGVVPTFIQWLIFKRWPKIGPIHVDDIVFPVIYLYASWMNAGVNSVYTSAIIVGVASQVWLRKYHRKFYKKYNYILAGGLDGGAQVMIFILSFAVFGASGKEKPFPSWWGNPANGNVDYCNGNGALDD